MLTRNLLFMSYGIVGMVQAAAGFFSYFVILHAGGWQWGQDLASTDSLMEVLSIVDFSSWISDCRSKIAKGKIYYRSK